MTNSMKNLFDAGAVEDVKQRIMRLRLDSERQWGKTPVALVLAHCTSCLQMAMGVVNPRRAPFPGNVIGLLIKPLVLSDKPMRRNSPSVPELFTADPTQCEFECERDHLIEAIDRFVSLGEACCSRHPHPFFGHLKPDQWATLMYKHIDHHLLQFGV
jgi:Protein of unknown function (DUF1569)